ncbi:MAG: T9SS type A sorting domain-containing protein [bacterium]|nr:T9SS type A sorting domain-containing protein [bacterium]
MLFFRPTQAATLHVPDEYATIQDALDSTSAFDTVLVAPGIYHEFLIGPDHSFTLAGWYQADTVANLRTLLDPIPQAAIDTPSVFVVTGDTAVVTNIAFYNRPELRQLDGPTRSGGIENDADLIRVENCRFDSVSSAIEGGQNIVVSNCTFAGCVGPCIQPDLGGRLSTTDSYFEASAYALVFVYNNSRIENCVFACNTLQAHFLVIHGSNILIDSCRFGPCVGAFWALDIVPITDVVIQDCLFEGLDRVYSIIAVGAICDRISGVPVTIRGNTFRDNHNIGPASGVLAITMQCAVQPHGYLGVIENNAFLDGSSNVLTAGVHSLQSSLDIRNNTFADLDPANLPDILAEGTSEDTIFARDNSLFPPGLAASRTNSYFDARENWWGDSTGPYNINENPEGQGSEVANGVLFVPWLTHPPDTTTDTNHVSIEEPLILQPSSFALSAYPNPFNATTTLQIEVPHSGTYEVVLYNITGREVANLFSGNILSHQTIRVNAEQFSSGVYFAQLRSPAGPLTTTKLLLLK